jgi:hypothetical protein
LIVEEKQKGNPLTPRDDCLMFYAGPRERHFNQTRVAGYNFTDPFDLTKAEIEVAHKPIILFNFKKESKRI